MNPSRTLLQARLDQACEALIARLSEIFDETVAQIVTDVCNRLAGPAAQPVLPKRRGPGRPPKHAWMCPDPTGGFEMTLPDGQVWHASRARDLRRKARQRGIVWREWGL